MEDQIKCPKCGSTQIHADKKGFSAGKAVAGVVLTGGIGLAAGAIGKNKIIITCLKCGNQFKPGEGTETSHNDQQSNHSLPYGVSVVKPKTELITYNYKCPLCEKVYSGDMHHCPKCGRTFLEKDKIEKSKEKNAGCAGIVLLFIMTLTGSLIAIF